MSVKRSVLLVFVVALFALITGVFAQDDEAVWVRIAHLVNDGSAVDVRVDGAVAMENVAVKTITDYEMVDAGMHSFAVSAVGMGADSAMIAPTDVDLVAGHRYTIAAIGAAADNSVSPLVIDETEAFTGMEVEQSSPNIFINNLSGDQAIDVILDGEAQVSGLAPGHYAVFTIPPQNFDMLAITTADDEKAELFSTPIFFEPSVLYLVAMTGTYPGELGSDFDIVFPEGVTPRNTIDFLKGFSGLDIGFANFPEEVELPFEKQHFTFDTLLKALDIAGLTDMLQTGDSYTLFAPTDDAFAALPAGTLDEWMADPAALTNLLQYHVVDGAMSMDNLLEAGSVTTLQGGKLDFTPLESALDAFAINGGVAGCGCNYHTSNGYVFALDHVLTPQ